jgi:hypothetical protein
MSWNGDSSKERFTQVFEIDGSYDITSTGTGATLEWQPDSDFDNMSDLVHVIDDTYAQVYTSDISGYLSVVAFELDTSYNVTVTSPNIEFPPHASYRASAVGTGDGKILSIFFNASIAVNNGESRTMQLTKDSSDDNYYIEEGQNSFLRRADNGLLYWFTDRNVSSIDGSVVGGYTGTISKDIIQFASYTEIVDAVDTRGYLYIGLHGQLGTEGSVNSERHSTRPCGVYVWDRQSTVLRTRDYFPVEGAREIKKMFLSRMGDVMLITTSNTGYCELRKLQGTKFVVVAKFDNDGYPVYHDSLTYADNLMSWQGYNGIIYAYGNVEPGEPEVLHKIGSISANASGTFSAGIMLQGAEGSNQTGEWSAGMYLSWRDDSTNKLSKWYPMGEGTLNSVAQSTDIGNVYSKVQYLPRLSTIRDVTFYCLPTTTSDDTTIATVKYYKNNQSTPFMTKSVTNTEAARGYVADEINSHNINAMQVEVEWANATCDGDEEFYPAFAVVNYENTTTHTHDSG